MIRLAICHDGATVTRLDDLAKAEKLSSNFLVQILNDLRRAGLVASRRGKSGGYLLTRAPDAINLREITEAIEGSVFDIREFSDSGSGPMVKETWDDIAADFAKSLESKTLQSLLPEETAPMFYI